VALRISQVALLIRQVALLIRQVALLKGKINSPANLDICDICDRKLAQASVYISTAQFRDW